MSTFFDDTMLSLLEAVEIQKGNIEVEEVTDMPAKTYRAKEYVTDSTKNDVMSNFDKMASKHSDVFKVLAQ